MNLTFTIIMRFDSPWAATDVVTEYVDDKQITSGGAATDVVTEYVDDKQITSGGAATDVVTESPFPAFPAIRQKEISDMVAGSVVSYLAEKGISAWIKQPNDIYVEKKKICGMLIKHRVSGANLVYTIAGIGININETSFPADLPNPTSIAVELGDGVLRDTKKELQNYLEHFISAAEKLFLLA